WGMERRSGNTHETIGQAHETVMARANEAPDRKSRIGHGPAPEQGGETAWLVSGGGRHGRSVAVFGSFRHICDKIRVRSGWSSLDVLEQFAGRCNQKTTRR